MIRSVTYQMIGRNTAVMAAIKYQLPAMFAGQSPNTASIAASVIPNRSASSCRGSKLAEKPPETPAKAAAMPAAVAITCSQSARGMAMQWRCYTCPS